MKKDRILKFILIILGTILCLTSIFIYSFDKNFTLRWLVLVLWLGGLIMPIIPAAISFSRKKSLVKNKYEFLFIVFLILISELLRFYKINEIPLLNGDEARDAGFLPEAFLQGKIKDFFGYGIYLIPNMFFILASIPHLLFGHSILSIRFFSAFFGTLAVILVYFLAKELFNRRTAAISAILMSSYQIHLQFSRSEFINNFDSFWAPLIIILLFKTMKKKPYYSLLFGLSLGIAFHFYQAIRAFLLFSAAYFFIWNLATLHKSFKNILQKTKCFLLGLLLGLGPSIIVIFTRTNEVFNSGGRFIVTKLGLLEFVNILPERLRQSFGALIYYPINFHYHYGGPFLRFPLNLFFIIGILIILKNFSQKKYNILLFWIISVIFCNSVLTLNLNFTHRLLSIVPALMIVSGIGIINLAKIFKEKAAFYNLIVFLFISISIFLNLKSYFFDSIWKNAYNINTKVATTAGYYSASFPSNTKFYFLNSSRMGWKSVPSWAYIAPKSQVEDLPEEKLKSTLPLLIKKRKRLIFIALPERSRDLKIIEKTWPQGLKKDHYYGSEFLFTSYQLR